MGAELVRVGLGSVGGTIGDGEAWGAAAVGDGLLVAVDVGTGRGELLAFTAVGVGLGTAVAACADPISSAGVSRVPAAASSNGRRRSGTARTLGSAGVRRSRFGGCKPVTVAARPTSMEVALRVREGDGRMAATDPLTQLYVAHYRGLVRLAGYLTGDAGTAEEVVQDAYVKVLGRWGGLRDVDKGAAYLRQAVVNLSRSGLRHRQVVERHAPAPDVDAESAESGAMSRLARDAVVAALAELPRRQREALVLRYYADLSEAQTAHAMGISAGAVKSHTSRGIAALRHLLEEDA